MQKLYGQDEDVFIYLDDILVASEPYEKYYKSLQTIFKIIIKNKILLNRKKCEFCKAEINFLGNIITEGTVKANLQ